MCGKFERELVENHMQVMYLNLHGAGALKMIILIYFYFINTVKEILVDRSI